MTAAETTVDKLPPFEGDDVAYSVAKFSGTGTGFSDGQKIAPVALHKGDVVYFVVKVTVSGVDHHDDKDGLTFRRHDMTIKEMAPVSDEIATAALQSYAKEIERIKEEMDPQSSLFDQEQAAAEREAADQTDTPNEIAEAAAKRAKNRD